jgi:hypothetical protein
LVKSVETVVFLTGFSISVKELCSSVRVVIGSPPWPRSFLPGCSVWSDGQLSAVWVVPHFLHFQMRETTVLLNFQHSRNSFIQYPFPDICLITILSRRSTDSSLDFIV